MVRKALFLLVGLGLARLVAAAEVQRTVRAELTGADLARFEVENLAGEMRISTAAGDRVVVVATVHAEDASLADAVRLERVSEQGRTAVLRVRYPYDRVSRFRYREPGRDDGWSFLERHNWSHFDYDGHSVKVSPGGGTPLWADLDIQVPAGKVDAVFRNLVGRITANGVTGNLRFGVESADLRLERLDGEIDIEGSSGDISARDIRGSWTSEFASGDCRLEGFDGERLSFHTASGDLVARHIKADRMETETASGDVSISGDLEEFEADSASGDVALTVEGSRLKAVEVSTSSGDVSLGLPSDASFEARADQSSGDMYVDFREGDEIRDDDTLVGYRRGSGGARIRVSTASGDFSLRPR